MLSKCNLYEFLKDGIVSTVPNVLWYSILYTCCVILKKNISYNLSLT